MHLLLLAALLLPCACQRTEDPVDTPTEKGLSYYTNLFAFNIMHTFYLWVDEMSDALSDWKYGDDPVEKVEAARYKDADGNLVDKWTRVLPDYHSFLGSLTGNNLSYGFEFSLYYADQAKEKVCMVVKYTYGSSPAAKAGILRGHVITSLDGEELTADNYTTLLQKFYESQSVRLGFSTGKTVTLEAVQMYENPVQTSRTLTVNGKSIGYLHFTSFTMEATRDLERVFRTFKEKGVEELVLDLRYNGGGYTLTSAVLASMIAPPEDVTAGKIFNKELFNAKLTEENSEHSTTPFATDFHISSGRDSYSVHPGEVNPGIRKLWVITTEETASASEALICGLKPYMDVTLVGEKTYGKFCGGYLIQAQDWYTSLSKQKDNDEDCDKAIELTKDWGIYVISSRYSDCNGVTLSMPSGIPADYQAKDNPLDGTQLGDPAETMFATALALSAGTPVSTKSPATAGSLEPLPHALPAGYGIRVNQPAL